MAFENNNKNLHLQHIIILLILLLLFHIWEYYTIIRHK